MRITNKAVNAIVDLRTHRKEGLGLEQKLSRKIQFSHDQYLCGGDLSMSYGLYRIYIMLMSYAIAKHRYDRNLDCQWTVITDVAAPIKLVRTTIGKSKPT